MGQTTILGVDKTYNLGPLHVTPTVFKNLSLVRYDTRDHPLFMGPVLIHGNSDFAAFATFLSTISTALDTDNPILMGSDEEGALRKAMKRSFPSVDRIACELHLKNNSIEYLQDKVGVNAETRKLIIAAIYGDKGLTSCSDKVDYEEKVSEVLDKIRYLAPGFTEHFRNHILPILAENLQSIWKYPLIDLHWTNNNCESINHILKLKINWTPQSIPELIDNLHQIVQSHYCDVERAIIRRGNFRLAKGFEKFQKPRNEWRSKSQEQKDRHLKKFYKMPMLVDPKQTNVSSDGNLWIYSAPGGGKKKGQRKRKRNARTTSNKKQYIDNSNSD